MVSEVHGLDWNVDFPARIEKLEGGYQGSSVGTQQRTAHIQFDIHIGLLRLNGPLSKTVASKSFSILASVTGGPATRPTSLARIGVGGDL
jgi:hypothetical protein